MLCAHYTLKYVVLENLQKNHFSNLEIFIANTERKTWENLGLANKYILFKTSCKITSGHKQLIKIFPDYELFLIIIPFEPFFTTLYTKSK